MATNAKWLRSPVPVEGADTASSGEPRIGAAAYVVVGALLLFVCEPHFISTGMELIASVLLIPIVALAIRRPRAARRGAPTLVVTMCFLMALSSAWSDNGYYTLLLAVSYSAFAVTAGMLAARLALGELNHIVAVVLFAFSVVCIGLAAAVPSVGLDNGAFHQGALQGFFYQKNLFAYAMVVATVTSLTNARWGVRRKAALGAWYAVLILLAHSSTALVVAGGALATLAVLRPLAGSQMWRLWLPYTGLILCLSVVVAVTNLDEVSAVVGRDATLTGRTTIWQAVWDNIGQQPFTGTGWGAAWRDGDVAGDEIRAYVGGYISHAHNGVLDVWLQLGVGGAILLVLMLGQLLVGSVVRVAGGRLDEFRWLSGVAVVLVMYSVDETRATKLLGWWLMTVGLCYVTDRKVRERTSETEGFVPYLAGGTQEPPSVWGRATPSWVRAANEPVNDVGGAAQ